MPTICMYTMFRVFTNVMFRFYMIRDRAYPSLSLMPRCMYSIFRVFTDGNVVISCYGDCLLYTKFSVGSCFVNY
jgi:hypothetical protein